MFVVVVACFAGCTTFGISLHQECCPYNDNYVTYDTMGMLLNCLLDYIFLFKTSNISLNIKVKYFQFRIFQLSNC